MFLALLACNGPQTFLTYNAGLAVGFVPGAEDRAARTAAAVGGVDADLVCLQEVWRADHAALFTEGWASSYVPEAQQELGEGAACTEDELETLQECLDDNCADTCTDELVDCVFENCAFPFLGLETECQSCVMANVGGEIDAVTQTCLEESTGYAYGGSFGTALLSPHELVGAEEYVFSSTTNRRSALHAVMQGPAGDVDVYCTHLTAVFDLIPYTGESESWDAEQANQVDELRAWIDETATNPVVMLGDMNNGPAVAGMPADNVNNYNALSAGYQNPYVKAELDCTYCSDNALNSEDSEDRVIDHVLFRDFDGDYVSERALDAVIDVESCGATFDGAYSDHYGVMVTAQ